MKNILIFVILSFTVCGCANQPNLDDNPDGNIDPFNKLGKKVIDPSHDPYNK